ncbi:MAG: polymer-forming cytoskeletal protein [Burkholderiaceae bacterium]|jgi:cytoskeletal protein CcmA (bactofilin family)
MFGKKPGVTNTIESLIGAATRIEGDVHFVGGLRIDGYVQGSVLADPSQPSMLVISEQARVDGQIQASHLVVNGTINGPVRADELIELQPRARVCGDVEYRALEMHHGAIVTGRLAFVDDESRPGLKLASNNG